MTPPPEPIHPIGLPFTLYRAGGVVRHCTIADIHKTYDSKGQLVKVRYVVTHSLAGTTITDYDTLELTITKALAEMARRSTLASK